MRPDQLTGDLEFLEIELSVCIETSPNDFVGGIHNVGFLRVRRKHQPFGQGFEHQQTACACPVAPGDGASIHGDLGPPPQGAQVPNACDQSGNTLERGFR